MTVTWEYKTLPNASYPYHDPADRLNNEGSQGWELVCATSSYFVFKRPKVTPDSQPEQEEVVPIPLLKVVATHRGIAIEVLELLSKGRVSYQVFALVNEVPLTYICDSKEKAIEVAKAAIDLHLKPNANAKL